MADTSLINLNESDVSKLKVPDLKKELKQRGLSTIGNKNELVERLQSVLSKSSDKSGGDSIDDIEEDLLNDDDDEHLDTTESVINEIDKELDESPTTLKRKLDTHVSNACPAKKVVLNRNVNDDVSLEPIKKPEEKVDVLKDDDKKVVKLSELSAKERLEMRAKKFGVSAFSDEAKKAVRAERFGSSVSSASNGSISLNNSRPSIDVLKQRAARFGQSVSSIMTDLEKQSQLEKRKQRFGLEPDNVISSSDKAQARLERFKQPVK